MENEKYIVVSYVPLLQPSTRILDLSGQHEDNLAIAVEIADVIEQTPDIDVRACLWLQDTAQHTFCPVLLIDNADEVMNHLVHWAEENPSEWFYLYLEKIANDRYIILLFPNLSKSIQRFKIACMEYKEFIPQSDADYTLLFKPLEFLSNGAATFEHVEQHLTKEIMLGFLNTADFDQNTHGTCVNKVRYIGPIARVLKADSDDRNSYIIPYVESRLKNITESE